ncbi:integration host factor subunit alpha [Klebsiella pneumoniae]|nr:integration host factor subunit alpha [Klebsiella pneumoniae]
MALTKAEMSEYLFDKLGLSKRDAKELVELFFEEIRRALENGEQVKLSGFGNFDLRDKNQRPGRNPKTGEDIPLQPARGDLQTRSEAEKPCRKRVAERQMNLN